MPPQISSARPGAGRGTAHSSGGFRGTGAFKPPRPVAGGAASKASVAPASAAKTSSRGRPSVGFEISNSEDDDAEINETDRDNGDDRDELERSRVDSVQRRRRTIDQFQGDEGEFGNASAAGAAVDMAGDSDHIAADEDGSQSQSSKSLPPALLARLLHHFFQNPNGTTTRLTQDAHVSINKYMEIFIREAVARSVAERRTGAFLDVDVLQKVAGQLIMDM
ncbi:hypothetical protein SEPCBS57363_004583 [Sporothrix epigloea]|uniref:CENP-S complex, centromere protein X n=1 Tax=Sporothrix epigloea TaxID=1892477 RepID=A0ABP0DSR4_9PEZI